MSKYMREEEYVDEELRQIVEAWAESLERWCDQYNVLPEDLSLPQFDREGDSADDWVADLEQLYLEHRRGLITEDELREDVKLRCVRAVDDAIIDAYDAAYYAPQPDVLLFD